MKVEVLKDNFLYIVADENKKLHLKNATALEMFNKILLCKITMQYIFRDDYRKIDKEILTYCVKSTGGSYIVRSEIDCKNVCGLVQEYLDRQETFNILTNNGIEKNSP